MLTEAQWKKIQDKYAGLMYTIATRIGQDKITHDIDDNQQELALAAIDAVKGYAKKTGLEFEEFFDTQEFNKYIKTCLWNKKNKLGSHIKKNLEIRKYVSIPENPELFEITNSEVTSVESKFSDIELDSVSKRIVESVLNDVSFFKPNGKINITKLAKHLGESKSLITNATKNLKIKFKDYDYQSE